MDLAELNQHFELVRKLQSVQEMYEKIEAKSLGAQALTGMPHGTGVSDKVGMLAAELADLSSRLDYLKEQVEKSTGPVEEFTDTIENERTRKIFRYRFLYGMSWGEVAGMFGSETSEAVVKMDVQNYFKKNSRVLR